MYNLNQKNQPDIIQVRQGELLAYKGYVHISVGIGLEYQIGNGEILQLKNSGVEYENPENMSERMTGGDAATQIFQFEAVAVGETELTISNNFRGRIESQQVWKIIVIS